MIDLLDIIRLSGSIASANFIFQEGWIIDVGEILTDVLIEAGMAVRYDGGKQTQKWCE